MVLPISFVCGSKLIQFPLPVLVECQVNAPGSICGCYCIASEASACHKPFVPFLPYYWHWDMACFGIRSRNKPKVVPFLEAISKAKLKWKDIPRWTRKPTLLILYRYSFRIAMIRFSKRIWNGLTLNGKFERIVVICIGSSQSEYIYVRSQLYFCVVTIFLKQP